MNTDAPKGKKWLDYVVPIIAAIIAGVFGIRAAGEGTRLSISATQTAEALLTYTPTSNVGATAIYQNAISTQQALVSTQQAFAATQQAFSVTATAIASNMLVYQLPPSPQPTQQSSVTSLSTVPNPFNVYSFILFAWFIFALSRPLPRQRLFKTIIALASEPIIFKHSESNHIRLYPRNWLEKIATRIKTFFERLNSNIFLSSPERFVKRSTSESSFIGFTEIIMLGVFIVLLYANLASVINALKNLGQIVVIPQWLTHYWIALLAGSLISTIVGIWVVADQRKKLVFKNEVRVFIQLQGYFLVISGLSLALIFSLARYAELDLIPFTFLSQTEIIIINVLIPLNITVATFITSLFAGQTFSKLTILLIGYIVYTVGILIALLLSLLLLLVDFQIRILLINIQITLFLALSPFGLLVEKFYVQQTVS